MSVNLMLQDEKYRFAVMSVLLGISFFLVYYFHFIMGTKIIFTHFFYIPIILSAIWWKRKAIIIPFVLAIALLLSNIITGDMGLPFIEDLFRSTMFIFVGIVVIYLAEIIEKSGNILAESEEKYRSVVESANEAIITVNNHAEIVSWNKAAQDIFGYKENEILGKSVTVLMPDRSKKLFESEFKTNENRHKKFHDYDIEFNALRKDGNEFPFELSGAKWEFKGEKFFTAIMRDVTKRKKIEEALKSSEEKYRELFNSANDMISLNMLEKGGIPGKFIEINDVGCKRLGYTKKEFLEMTPKNIVAPECFSKMPENAAKLAKFSYAEYEMIHITKDGKKIPVEVNNHIFKLNGKTVALAISRDITERKKTEKQLKASLKEKDMLVKEIHHRVKNNLMVISSLLNLQSQYIKDKEALNIFKESQSRAQSMALIHERLYRSDDMKKIDFGEYIKTLSTDLYRTYVADQEHINLNLDVDDAKIDINTSVPLGLIVNELVSNCLKHAFPANYVRGPVNGTLASPGEKIGEINITFKKSNDEFILDVKDNGIGFPEELDFKNTDSLGLQLVTSLVGQIDGKIELKSKNGTEFRITFSELYKS